MRTLGSLLPWACVVALALSMSGCASKKVTQPSPARQEYDYKFLVTTSDHLMNDIRIANSCKGKNIRSELSNFCNALLVDQTKEQEHIGQMLRQWYAKEPHRDPYPLWLEGQQGSDFEKAFLDSALKGHAEIGESAGECVRKASHPELVALCREMVEHRSKEAIQMKEWNCNWFRRCR